MDALLSGPLRPVLDFEHEQHQKRGGLIAEIRDNQLTLYFLGHGIQVERTERTGQYYLRASKTFDPSDLLGNRKKIVKPYGKDWETAKDWKISFDDIGKDFESVIEAVIAKIVAHKHGNISEGVSESNHFIDNRASSKNGVLIIDRQVCPGDHKDRIDLLGLKRLPSDEKKATFAVAELKNGNNPQIAEVFSQLKRYIDRLFEKEIYESFREIYSRILEQKSELGMLVKFGARIAPFSEISKKDIAGIVVLDNFNIRRDKGTDGLLGRALKDWDRLPKGEYNISLFLKSNVLDSVFSMDRKQAGELLERYKICNS